MILFEKNVAKRSANDFEYSQVGKVVLWDLCRTLCNSRHSFLESWNQQKLVHIHSVLLGTTVSRVTVIFFRINGFRV